MRVRLSELASRFGLDLRGPDAEVSGLSTLQEASSDELAFLANPRYADELPASRAAGVIVDPAHADMVAGAALVTDNPYLAVAYVSQLFAKPQGEFEGVSPLAFVDETALVDPSARIMPFAYVGPRAVVGAGVSLFAHVYVGEDCAVGEGSILYPHVTLMASTKVGRGVIVHAGTVLGADGFGYAQGPQGHVKVAQTGTVEVGDQVEIGANTCVDRGSRGVTRIGPGCKIDNQCQIAHNVELGPACILVAQVGISGSTKLGQGVVLAGQVGVTGHLEIGDGAQIGAQAGVMRSVPAGSRQVGSPAMDAQAFMRIAATMPKLPDMAKRLARLEKELAALKAAQGEND